MRRKNSIREALAKGLSNLLRRYVVARRPPDFTIGGAASPTMHRWWVLPRNDFFNVYLHLIVDDDADRELHDHRGLNLSFVLDGRHGYVELLPADPANPAGPTVRHARPRGSLTLRRATDPHRVVLYRDEDGDQEPALSLFVMVLPGQEWGFYCPQGWVPWQRYLARRDAGEGSC